MIRACLIVLSLLVASGAVAQERRLALVVGIGAYQHHDFLPHAVSDASTIAAALARSGFTVTLKQDLTQTQFDNALSSFEATISPADVALIYFSGHAVQVHSRNVLLTVESDIGTSIGKLTRFGKLADVVHLAKFRIIILDACRLNSTDLPSDEARDLKPEYPADETAIIFSAEGGREAWDGNGPNGPFVASFTKRMSSGLELVPTMRLVTQDVRAATAQLGPDRQQTPELRVSGATAFYFGASFSILPGADEPARNIARALEAEFGRAGFVLDRDRPTVTYDLEVESRTIGPSLDGPDRVIVTVTKHWTDPTLVVPTRPVRAEFSWRNPNSSSRSAAEQLYRLLLPTVRE